MDANVKYRTNHRKYLLLDSTFTGDFDVWFKKYPQKVDSDTADTFEIELDYDIATLVPYLMAHDVWLDDDPQKAVMYYNKYDDLKNQIFAMQSRNTIATVKEDERCWF
jgi:hypothetical protein